MEFRNFCPSSSITRNQIKKLTSFPEVVRRSTGRSAPFLISGEIRGSSMRREGVRVNAPPAPGVGGRDE